VSPVEGGTTNWQPPAYSPQTGLFYTQEQNAYNMLYLTDPDPRGSMGLGGKMRVEVGATAKYLTAIDPATGKVAWRRPYADPSGGGAGIGFLTTAGGLLFGVTAAATSLPTTREPARRSGTPGLAHSQTRRRRIWWVAASTSL
jgi:alcohol dehydrogenase (cytochrome c)